MNRKRILQIGIPVALTCALVVGCTVYLNTYYRAAEVGAYLEDSSSVRVTEEADGFFFDGEGEENLIVFYPGAKVDTAAYAPLLYTLAEEGVDCYLVDMPFHMAIFGVNKAERILERTDYAHTYLMGHSMGGAMAASFVNGREDVDGLIFLAAYTAEDLSSSSLRVLSLYGSEDKVLNLKKVEEGRKLVPKEYKEVVIKGGNHAQFGAYGEQSGDGEAVISAEEQREATVREILAFVENKD